MNQEIFSLRSGTAELGRILYEGTVWRHGEPWIALPREVVAQTVVFEIVRPEEKSHPRSWTQWIQALRLEGLAMTAVPALTIGILGRHQGLHPQWVLGILSYIGVFCLQLGLHFLNEVDDHLNLLNLPGRRADRGVLQKGWLTAQQLRTLGVVTLALGCLAGLPAILRSPSVLIGVSLLGGLGILAYSYWPRVFRRGPLSDFMVWFLLGPLVCVGYSISFFEAMSAGSVVIGLFFGFLAWTVHHADHLAAPMNGGGRKSLASALGYRSARLALVLGYLLSFICLGLGVGFGWLPWGALISLVGGVRVFVFLRNVYRASGPSSVLLSSVTEQATHLYFRLGLFLAIGLGFLA